MFLRRSMLAVLLVVAANAAAACGDTTGEPIYQDSQTGPIEGAGGSEPGTGGGPGDPNNDRACPSDVPDDNSRCQVHGQTTCRYGNGTVECDCNNDNWDCDFRCPMLPPNPWESSCLTEGKRCNYQDLTCFCTEASWTCLPGPEQCPSDRPEEGTPCDVPQQTLCGYGMMTNCSCNHNAWDCR